jgi:hypothetical protein
VAPVIKLSRTSVMVVVVKAQKIKADVNEHKVSQQKAVRVKLSSR